MATNETTANVVTLHPVKAKTPAERAAAYRLRKKGKAGHFVTSECPTPKAVTTPVTSKPINIPVTPSRVTKTVTISLAPVMLHVTAFGLAAVGITMNGWFAHTLGSSQIAGWLFAAIGVAADLVALALPSAAARLWQTRQRGIALAGWAVWLATFAFAVTAGIGFASVNITDVTASRASRVTPAVTAAHAALADAMTSRDRECAGGVGKNCRTREEAVSERRRNLDAAMAAVEQTADPQTEATRKIVAWLSIGFLRPTGDDFAMLRLILLSLLPQLGGILLMVGRSSS